MIHDFIHEFSQFCQNMDVIVQQWIISNPIKIKKIDSEFNSWQISGFVWCNTFVLHTVYVDSWVLSFPIWLSSLVLFFMSSHRLALAVPAAPPPSFLFFSVQRRMNTWMTIACGWQLRFAGTSAVREQFTGCGGGSGELGLQADNPQTKKSPAEPYL